MKRKIHINKVNYESIDYKEIKNFFESEGFLVFLEEDPLLRLDHKKLNEIALFFAKSRILNTFKRELNENPLNIEVEYEKRNLISPNRKKGIIYDGYKLVKIYRSFISKELVNIKDFVHFFLTDQLISTFSDRWHLRVIIFSFPVLISIPGIIYAPAKDRDYYISSSLGHLPVYKEYYLTEKDRRITKIICAYIIQGIFFYNSILEKKEFEFCNDRHCLLYNSHYQRELIEIQFNLNFCDKHKKEWKKIVTLKNF
ncbi:MAG: DUF6775 family putative metallopeptidase [Candidatus Hydrothermales bacterium]